MSLNSTLLMLEREDGSRRVQTVPGEKSLTKQSEAKYCDLNAMMAKGTSSRVQLFAGRYQPRYGTIVSVELQDALNTVAEAQGMFDALPAKLRKKFGNDPGAFCDFVSAEENLPEMYELGLAVKPEKAKPISVEVVKSGPADPGVEPPSE